MKPEYDSLADDQDQNQNQLKKEVDDIQDGVLDGKDIYDKINKKDEQDIPDGSSHQVNPKTTNNPVERQDLKSHASDAARTASADTGKEAVKQGGKEAGKEAAKEAAQNAAKEAGKEAGKEAAKAAIGDAAARGVDCVAPGVGLAIEAGVQLADKTVGQIKEVAKKTGEVSKNAEKTAKKTVDAGKKDAEGFAAKISNVKSSTAEANDSTSKIIVFFLFPLFLILAIVLSFGLVMSFTLQPVLIDYNSAGGGKDYSLVCNLEITNIRNYMKTAIKTTSKDEIEQIISEHPEYDSKLTMQSYKDNKCPYVYSGKNCNVNYLEIYAVLSECPDYYDENGIFSTEKMNQAMADPEFLRCLYDLKVEPAIYEKKDLYGNVVEKIPYGQVTLSKYPLKKLYDFIGVDPSAPCKQFPLYTNYQALSLIQQYTQAECPAVDWGSKEISIMSDYTLYTGSVKSLNIPCTDDNVNLLAQLIHHEAGNQCRDGKIAVGEVVMNRIRSTEFPNNIYDVIYQPGQFAKSDEIESQKPSEDEIQIANDLIAEKIAVFGNAGVLFFRNSGGDKSDWGTYKWYCEIQNHEFYLGNGYSNGYDIYGSQSGSLDNAQDCVSADGIPLYKQGDAKWGRLPYGSGTMASLGCCLTSFSMIASYFSQSALTPDVVLSDCGGSLQRASLAARYGFKEYDGINHGYTLGHTIDELNSGHLCEMHIKKGGYDANDKCHPKGHWIVVSGYEKTSDGGVDYIVEDPASGTSYKMSSTQAEYNFDVESSYGQ